MSDNTHANALTDGPSLPTRAEFIRDRLAEHLVSEGCAIEAAEHETEFDFPTLAYSYPGGGEHVAVSDETPEGRFLDVNVPPGYGELTFDRFSWRPVPTDTGAMHRPMTEHAARRAYWRASLGHTCDPYVSPGQLEEQA